MGETPDTLTILVPALNEAASLEAVVRHVAAAASAVGFDDYEIVIVNDGSTDGTAAVAERLAAGDARIRVVHHARRRNLGGALKSGLAVARMGYVCTVHGNGGTPREQLERIWARRGEADLVIPYILNARERPPLARALSRAFTLLLNTLFGLRVRYYLHHVLYRRERLAALTIRTNSYAYQPEAVIKLLRQGCTHVAVGVVDDFSRHGRTRSYSLRNVAGVALFLARCLFDVHAVPRVRSHLLRTAPMPP